MVNIRKCTGPCGRELEENSDNFYWRKNAKNPDPRCKQCMYDARKEYFNNRKEQTRLYDIEYREKNKEKRQTYAKQYSLDHKEERKVKDKEYRDKNKESIREKKRVYKLNRRKNDFMFKLREYVSSQINICLKNNKSSKNNESIDEYMPYTILELKNHIESLFESWMNWDNRGIYNSNTWDDNDTSTWTWQLDHIIPQSDFKITSLKEAFQECWVLHNLRPLSAKQNCLDGARRTRHKKKTGSD